MNVSTIVVSTVAALSMASVLGIAYAQSTYSDPQTGTTDRGTTTGTMNEQDATGTQGSTNTDSRTDMDATSTSRSQPTYNARVARADRN